MFAGMNFLIPNLPMDAWLDSEPNTEPMLPAPEFKTCLQCGIELSEVLDAYYGHDEFAKELCAKCRK